MSDSESSFNSAALTFEGKDKVFAALKKLPGLESLTKAQLRQGVERYFISRGGVERLVIEALEGGGFKYQGKEYDANGSLKSEIAREEANQPKKVSGRRKPKKQVQWREPLEEVRVFDKNKPPSQFVDFQPAPLKEERPNMNKASVPPQRFPEAIRSLVSGGKAIESITQDEFGKFKFKLKGVEAPVELTQDGEEYTFQGKKYDLQGKDKTAPTSPSPKVEVAPLKPEVLQKLGLTGGTVTQAGNKITVTTKDATPTVFTVSGEGENQILVREGDNKTFKMDGTEISDTAPKGPTPVKSVPQVSPTLTGTQAKSPKQHAPEHYIKLGYQAGYEDAREDLQQDMADMFMAAMFSSMGGNPYARVFSSHMMSGTPTAQTFFNPGMSFGMMPNPGMSFSGYDNGQNVIMQMFVQMMYRQMMQGQDRGRRERSGRRGRNDSLRAELGDMFADLADQMDELRAEMRGGKEKGKEDPKQEVAKTDKDGPKTATPEKDVAEERSEFDKEMLTFKDERSVGYGWGGKSWKTHALGIGTAGLGYVGMGISSLHRLRVQSSHNGQIDRYHSRQEDIEKLQSIVEKRTKEEQRLREEYAKAKKGKDKDTITSLKKEMAQLKKDRTKHEKDKEALAKKKEKQEKRLGTFEQYERDTSGWDR